MAMTKTLSIIGLVILLETCALAQQSIDVEFSNGPGALIANSSNQLQFTGGVLVSVSESGEYPTFGGGIGTVLFTTPALARGVTANGGTFGGGGSFYIDSIYGAGIQGTFVRGSWKRIVLTDSTNEYVLTAEINGTLEWDYTWYNMHGMTVQMSLNTGTTLFAGIHNTSGGVTEAISIP